MDWVGWKVDGSRGKKKGKNGMRILNVVKKEVQL